MHDFKAKHFPALDGLRGLAILLVITHHQLIPLSLRGGFLGVDLFFALSGFLITTLLVTEFNATQTISLKKFYARRALRLGPALLLYLAVALIVTWHLTPNDILHQFKLVGFSLFYLANWRMAFGWDSSLDATAITWSLSIEEQFYLVWPFVLLICFKLGLKRWYIVTGLAFVILSIFLHRYLLMTHGSQLHRMYYGTDTRADAPLLGCLIALFPSVRLDGRRRAFLLVGATLAAFSFVYLVLTVQFTDMFLYFGGYTVIALIAGIITWSAANLPNEFLSKLLSWSPLRWFGTISYSLYLWHWLLLKTTSLYFLFGDLDAWARFGLAVAVSALSYYMIERPFNKLKSRYSYSQTAADVSQTIAPLPVAPPSLVTTFSTAPVIQASGQEL